MRPAGLCDVVIGGGFIALEYINICALRHCVRRGDARKGFWSQLLSEHAQSILQRKQRWKRHAALQRKAPELIGEKSIEA